MKKPKNVLFIFIITAMLTSCAMFASGSRAQSEEMAVQEMMEAPMAAAPMEKMVEETVYVEVEYADESAYSSGSVPTERIVIKNANLSIVVKDPDASMKTIAKMAEDMGGFVVNSNLYKTTTSSGIEVPNANITVRVPAENLDEALEQIKALVENPKTDILSEDVSGQDVTSEVTDLESRLRNLEAAEVQLLKIMEEAKKTEDVINVFRELTSVREEIEVIQGQIKYYRESASLSAISVYLQAKEAVEPITVGRWQPGVEAQKALQALVDGGKFIVNVLIWLGIFAIPILAVIFLPVFFIVKAIRKKKQTKIVKEAKKEKETK